MAKAINIAETIHSLLYEYNSVIVPGLGTFTSKRKPAQIDDNNNTIYPPGKSVEFNERLKLNDGILVSYIAQTEDLPITAIEEVVNNYVQSLHKQLNNGQTVEIEGIGYLKKIANELGVANILFKPLSTTNVDADTFGMTPIDLPSDNPTLNKSKTTSFPVAEPIDQNTDELETEVIPIPVGLTDVHKTTTQPDPPKYIQTPPSEKQTVSDLLASKAQNKPVHTPPPPSEKPKRAGFWLWLLPLIIIGLLAWMLSKLGKSDDVTLDNNKSKTTFTIKDADKDNNTNDVVINEIDNNATSNNNNANDANIANNDSRYYGNTVEEDKSTPKDNKSDHNDGHTQSNTTKQTPPVNKPKSETSTTASSNNSSSPINVSALSDIRITKAKSSDYKSNNAPKGYYVIVGAFQSTTNANKLKRKIERDGVTVHLLPTTHGWYRVGIHTGNDGKATKTQYQKSRLKHNKESWVLAYY